MHGHAMPGLPGLEGAADPTRNAHSGLTARVVESGLRNLLTVHEKQDAPSRSQHDSLAVDLAVSLKEVRMHNVVRATFSAAAAVAALLLAQPVQAALVQPHPIVSDIGKSANILDAVRYRDGGGGHRGEYWRRGGWGHRGWWYRRDLGYGREWTYRPHSRFYSVYGCTHPRAGEET